MMNVRSQVRDGSKNVLWGLTVLLVLTGVYNSILLNSDNFMNQDFGVRFVKRLDELHGKITEGRMAASVMKWTDLEKKKKIKPIVKPTVAATRNVKPIEPVQEKVEELAEPAITADLSLTLDQVFFKQPLAKGSFAGKARTTDGYIDEVEVSLPDGKTLYIDTRNRMVGNVFTYEDTLTGETKSGMFYEVKKGKQYMITLTNDSTYAGLRLGFTTSDYSEIKYDDNYQDSNVQWADNTFAQPNQNQNAEQNQGQMNNPPQGQVNDENGYSFDFDPNPQV